MKPKKKLLFLIPMHITFDSFTNPGDNTRKYLKKDNRNYNSLATDLPLGPLSMSAYIKKFLDVEVKLIDFNVELNLVTEFPHSSFYNYCVGFLRSMNFQPDVVGVSSLFSPSFDNFMDCGKAAKAIWPEAVIIGGGNIPTNNATYIYEHLECEDFDALCFGEGENPLRDCLAAEDMIEYFENSPNWYTRNKLRKDPKFMPQHNFVNDLDDIPFFDYDLCDIRRHGVNPMTPSYEADDQRAFHIMTSRGCPFLCTFCASHRTHGRSMRYHGINRVREDLTKLKKEYGATKVIFQDDHLMGDTDRVYDILEIVGELGLGSLYQNGLTLYALDRPMLEAFYAAGVRHLVLPVESGSEKVLRKQMRKPLKFRIAERVARDCRDLGIYTNANIIIGMPGETKRDLEEGLQNLRKVKANWFNIACASPLVGSEMHALALEKGYISGETMGSDFHKAIIKTEDFTPEYIQEFEYQMNLDLNFIHNNDLEAGEYELALRGFNNVLRVREDQAFAHYYAAVCHGRLKRVNQSKQHRDRFLELSETSFWKRYCEQFGLSHETLDREVEKDGTAPSNHLLDFDDRLAAKFGP
jgi:anaerobic magnesium-protoporphyrin IX monomethyl ester cyclase